MHKYFLENLHQELRIILRGFATTFLIAPQVDLCQELTIGLS